MRVRGGGVSLACTEDCLEVCFVGLVVGGNYTWYLVLVVIFMGFGRFKVINLGGNASQKIGTIFIEMGGVEVGFLTM